MGNDAASVFRSAIALLNAGRFDDWMDLWHDDGVCEFPFAPEGLAHELRGRDAIAAYMSAYPLHIDLDEMYDVVIHQTDSPSMIVAEMAGRGTVVATGDDYAMRYICVVTVEDGKIVRYRDYWNPMDIPASMLVADAR